MVIYAYVILVLIILGMLIPPTRVGDITSFLLIVPLIGRIVGWW